MKYLFLVNMLFAVVTGYSQTAEEKATQFFEINKEAYIGDAKLIGIKDNELEKHLSSIKEQLLNKYRQEAGIQNNDAAGYKMMSGLSASELQSDTTPGIDSSSFTSSCENVDFERNNFDFWVQYLGQGYQPNIAVPNGTDPNRIRIVTASHVDTNVAAPGKPGISGVVAPDGGQFSVRLGNSNTGFQHEQLSYKFLVKSESPFFIYRYALVLEDPRHDASSQPFFRVRILDEFGRTIECTETKYVADSLIPGFIRKDNGSLLIKDWTTNFLDLSPYLNTVCQVVFEVSDCAATGHYGYAYIDASCFDDLGVTDLACEGDTVFIDKTIYNNFDPNTTSVKVTFEGAASVSAAPVYYGVYNKEGQYKVKLEVNNLACPIYFEKNLVVDNCNDTTACCAGSFAPTPGEKYLLSGWVKENTGSSATTYTNPNIAVRFRDGANKDFGPFYPQGGIIDGWQRIEGVVQIPNGSALMFIELLNDGNNDVYFDDVRFLPFNSNMKSFVYDPLSKKLIAQHDENNYSTFYEYDEEGKLVRIKKETERGIKTIQESRSNLKKQP